MHKTVACLFQTASKKFAQSGLILFLFLLAFSKTSLRKLRYQRINRDTHFKFFTELTIIQPNFNFIVPTTMTCVL